MNELTEICNIANVDGLNYTQLRECISYGHAFSVDMTEWIIIGIAALLGMKVAVIGRKRPLAALEGLLLAPLAAYGGITGGQIFAQWVPPIIMGILLVFIALTALLFIILGLKDGNASAGWKALGTIEILVIVAGLISVSFFCFTIPDDNAATAYTLYLDAVTWLFAVCAIMDVLIVVTYGSYLWGVNFLLVPVNALWGAIGNLFGLIHHSASWHFFANQGGIRQDNRKFYTYYHNGIRLKSGFAFTQGAVMTGAPVEKHESQHVLQHFIFGPIFTLSYLIWFIPGAIIGLIVGLFMGKGIAGVEAWAYYNNPWEIWAYAVEGGRSQNGDTSLIWGPVASWIVAIAYYLLSVGLFILLLVLRH